MLKRDLLEVRLYEHPDTRARVSGKNDGAEAVRDAEHIDHQEVTPEEVERWFASERSEPDEVLIHACTNEMLATALGLTVAQVEARGDEWDAAIIAYNEGYRAGARGAAKW